MNKKEKILERGNKLMEKRRSRQTSGSAASSVTANTVWDGYLERMQKEEEERRRREQEQEYIALMNGQNANAAAVSDTAQNSNAAPSRAQTADAQTGAAAANANPAGMKEARAAGAYPTAINKAKTHEHRLKTDDPYDLGNAKLNKIYQEAMKTAEGWNVKDWNGLSPKDDVKQIIENFWDNAYMSGILNSANPNADPTGAAKKIMAREMEMLRAKYESNGRTAEEIAAMMDADGYKNPIKADEIWQQYAIGRATPGIQEERARQAEAQKKEEDKRGKEERENKAKLYGQMEDISWKVQDFGVGQLTPEEYAVWQEFSSDPSNAAALNSGDAQTRGKAAAAWGSRKAQDTRNEKGQPEREQENEAPGVTYEEADEYLWKNDALYRALKGNRKNLSEVADMLDSTDALIQRFQETGYAGLDETEQAVIDALTAASGDPDAFITGIRTSEGVERLKQAGKELAEQVRQQLGLATPDATPYQQGLWEGYISTPEGASAYTDFATGTEEETKAKTNQYWVEQEQRIAKAKADPNFAELSKPGLDLYNDPDNYMYRYIAGYTLGGNERGAGEQFANDVQDLLTGYKYKDYMTDEDKAIYYYYLRTGDKEEAKKYLEALEYRLDEQAMQKRLTEKENELKNIDFTDFIIRKSGNVRDKATGTEKEKKGTLFDWLTWNAGSIVDSVLGSPMATLDIIGQNWANQKKPEWMSDEVWYTINPGAKGMAGDYKPINYNSIWQTNRKLGDKTREVSSEQIADLSESLGIDSHLPVQIYNGLMSLADSRFGAKLFAGMGSSEKAAAAVGSLLGGSRAAAEAMENASEKGASDGQVVLLGALAGVSEAGWEYLTLSQWLKYMDKSGPVPAFQRLLEFGVVTLENGMQEGMTELTDIVSDAAVLGDKGDYVELANYLRDMGMNEDDIKDEVTQAMIRRVWYATEGGLIMGAMSDVGTQGYTARQSRLMYNQTGYNMSMQTRESLIDLGKNSNDKGAQRMANRLDAGKASDAQMGKLAYLVMRGMPAQMRQTLTYTMQQDMLRQAESKLEANKSPALISAESKIQNGQSDKLTPNERRAMAKYIQDSQAIDAMGKMFAGQELNEAEIRALAQSENSMDILRTLYAQDENSENGENDEQAAQDEDMQDWEPMPVNLRENEEKAEEEEEFQPHILEEKPMVIDREGKNEAEEEEEFQPHILEEKPEVIDREGKNEAEEEEEFQPHILEEKPEVIDREGRTAADEEEAPGNGALTTDIEERNARAREEIERQQAEEEAESRDGDMPATPIVLKDESGKTEEHKGRFKHTKDGLSIVLEDGSAQDADSMDLTDAQRRAVQEAEAMEGDEAANDMAAMLWGEEDEGTARRKALAYREAYEQGRQGVPYEERAQLYDSLTDDEARRAYDTGRRAAQREQTARDNQARQAARTDGYRAEADAAEGDTGVFYGDVKAPVKSNAAKTQLAIMDQYARENGLHIVVHDDMGNRNGKYTAGKGIIHVSLSADGGYLTRVATHEMFHYIMDQDAELGRQLRDFVLEQLRSKEGYDLEGRILDTQDDYRGAEGQDLTPEEAMDEIAADALGDVIGTEESIRKLARAQETKSGGNVTLLEKIKAWLQKTVENFRRMRVRYQQGSAEAAALKDDAEAMERMRQMVENALKEIYKNRTQGKQGLYSGIQEDADVKAYLTEKNSATTQEDARAALDGFVSSLFARTQKAWIGQNMDNYEQGYANFTEALRRFGNGEVNSLAVAMAREGLDAPMGQQENQLYSYAARQMAEMGMNQQTAADMQQTAEQEQKGNEESYSIKRDADSEQRNRQAMDDLRQDAELYAQMKQDEDERAAYLMLKQLHDMTTRGGENALIKKGAFEERLSDIAQGILEKYGSKYGKIKLMREMRKIYRGMESGQMRTGDLLAYTKQVMQEVLDTSPGVLAEKDDTTKEIMRILRETPFSLTADQINELHYTYGSALDFRRKNFGKMHIVKDRSGVTSLPTLWTETLNPMLPGVFAADTSEMDMPDILDAWLTKQNEKVYTNALGRSAADEATDMALDALLGFYDVPGALKTKNEIKDGLRQKMYEEEKARIDQIRQNAKNAIQTARDQYNTKYNERIARSQERKAETEQKQKLRGSIIRTVKTINKLNISPSDQRHVPEGMRRAALDAVRPFLDNTSVFSQANLDKLNRIYGALAERKGEMAGFDQDILDSIQTLGPRLNGRRLSELSAQELSDINDIVGNIHKAITGANEAFLEGRKTTIDALSGQLKADMAERKARQGKAAEFARKLSYKETTPIYFADRVGGVLGQMVRDLFTGQEGWAFTAKAAKDFADETAKKYNAKKWYHDKSTLRFTLKNGDQIELNRGQALSLYALWKRENTNKLQDAKHLRIGGFMYERGEGTKYKDVDTLKPHAISEQDMAQIKDWLTEEQMNWADEMAAYLSETLGKEGNKVSMQLYGYEKFKETYYFPYASDNRFLVGDLTMAENRQTQPKNQGFTKATLRNAATPIEMGDFMKTWANHVNGMALYVGFAQTMDTLNRVINDRISGEVMVNATTGEETVIAPESNRIILERALGPEGMRYLETLARDVSGGVRADERGWGAKELSRFKKAAVAANMSVVLQQPTAYARAMLMVSPRYLLTANPINIHKSVQEMYKYSGVAIIKNMGKFDTGTGRSAVEWLSEGVGAETIGKGIMNFTDEWTGKGAEKADEWTWGLLWDAISKEVANTQTDLRRGTDAFGQAVAERFNDVVNHTQVYDSVLSRSEWMRSNTIYDKMATSFMAEPTLTLNMLQDAIVRFKAEGGGGKRVARAAGAFVLNTLLNALAKSIMMATRRKKDDERTWLEKYVAEAAGNFVDDISPFGVAGMIPWVRDAMSIFDGYNVERSDMDAMQMLYKAYQTAANDSKSFEDKAEAVCSAVGNLFGVPVKNIWRDAEAIIRNIFGGASAPISETSGRDIKYSVLDNLQMGPIKLWDEKNKAYYDRLEQAALKGDTAKYEELYGYLTETKQVKPATVAKGVKAEIKDSVLNGLISEEKALDVLTGTLGMEEKKALDALDEWKDTAAHADEEDYEYSKYGDLYDLAKEGKDIKAEMADLAKRGVSEKDALGKIKTQIGGWYVSGEMNRATAEKRLKQYITTLDDNALYWLFDEWDAEKAGKKDEYGKYKAFYQAVETGVNLKDEAKRYMDHGVKATTLASQITSQYKQQYVALVKAGKKTEAANLKARIATAYEAIGYDRKKKEKDIDAWIKQEEKKNN